MISRCCRVNIYNAQSEYSGQLSEDWYECSHCARPCDTILAYQPWTDENDNEQL
jgi:hypothetical protein